MAENLNILRQLVQSLTAGIDATKRVWGNPTGVDPSIPAIDVNPYANRNEYYNRLWEYYNNTAFDDMLAYEEYREKFGLYRFQRSIYNPTTRLVDFYVHHVYPGFVTTTEKKLPEGVRKAIEFEDTSPELIDAIGQFWNWAGFQELKNLIVLRAAALGNTLVEIIDDVDTGKVWANCWWPGHVVDIRLDNPSRGNVTSYILEYRTRDPLTEEIYIFRKSVDRKFIRYYRDGEPFNYLGRGSVVPNPYGFVPAVWVRHKNIGEDYGQPAIAPVISKIDEINTLKARAHDRLFTLMQAPIVIATGGDADDLADMDKTNPPRKSSSQEFNDTATENRYSRSSRERMRIITAPENSSVTTIPLDVGQTLNWVVDLQKEIESDLRQLVVFDKLSGMSITTGPAIRQLMRDVSDMLQSVQSTYDKQMESLFRMSVAIGGWRANSGGWGPKDSLSIQQQKFLPFDLTSYAKGELAMVIIPRELFPQGGQEFWMEEKAKNDALFVAKQNGIPDEQRFLQWGASPEQAKQWSLDAQAAGDIAHQQAIELKTAGSNTGLGQGANPGPKPKTFAINNNNRPIPRRASSGSPTSKRPSLNRVRKVSTRA